MGLLLSQVQRSVCDLAPTVAIDRSGNAHYARHLSIDIYEHACFYVVLYSYSLLFSYSYVWYRSS